ncbi:ATP-binding protein [Wukongibacter baidiensis]|uniref:ATP-binding protein n=1 Tax=Wukongibacter baidiensis TaxID=1723361 RepID=UPI003D7F298D
MTKLKKILIGSLIVTLSSQFYIDILLSDFRVSCAIIALGLFLFLNRDISPIVMGTAVAFSTYLWRIAIYFLRYGNNYEVMGAYIPEIFFFIIYGILFSRLIKKVDTLSPHIFFIMFAMCDFTSNIIEILIRIVYYDHMFYFSIITSLFVVALIRSGAIWIAATVTKYYKMLLLKSEHEKRYRKLLWLTMMLKSEMYWMDKNMDKIEEVMSDAYTLFEEIRDEKNPDKWAKRSVKIASDVHEVKKEYELVLRGVQGITETRYKDNGMYFKDIMSILEEKMQNEIRFKNLDIELSIERGADFYTDKHYQLMSISRNLIMNAFDALDGNKKHSKISLVHRSLDKEHLFKVIDNGSGIDKKDMEFIFSPGFSTKINYETGHINRGLGLSLVKDIVENHLKGHIEIESVLGSGTCFSIYIPKEEIEVNI